MNNITINQIGCLLVRGIALFLALQMLSALGLIINVFTTPEQEGVNKGLIVFPYGMLAVLAILIWRKAPWFADRMVPESTSVQAPFTIENIQIVLLITLGFWLLAYKTFGDLLLLMSHIILFFSGQEHLKIWEIIEAILLLGLTLSLIFTPQGIVRIIKYARTTGGEK